MERETFGLKFTPTRFTSVVWPGGFIFTDVVQMACLCPSSICCVDFHCHVDTDL